VLGTIAFLDLKLDMRAGYADLRPDTKEDTGAQFAELNAGHSQMHAGLSTQLTELSTQIRELRAHIQFYMGQTVILRDVVESM